MHNDETPCKCPKCGWIGMFSDTDRYVPTDADFNELEPRNVCPKCTDEVDVQALDQKGLDGLRQEYATTEARSERQSHLERFFEHIGKPL
jgi:Zn finger protein HypA/HybF involved in hydrogenase expression